MDLQSELIDGLVSPEAVIADARCFASKEAFAVSVDAGGKHYCIAAKAEQAVPQSAQSGEIAKSDPIRCFKLKTTE